MSTENKYNEEAKKKVNEMVEDIQTAMFITGITKVPLAAIPMTHKKIDDKGDIWFLSPGDSDHNKDIIRDSKAQLLYSSPTDKKFLSLYGKAEIVLDPPVLEDLYSKNSNNWFSGVNDPNLTAIKFTPKEAYYWDTKTNKYIDLIKMGISAILGKKTDVNEKGELNM